MRMTQDARYQRGLSLAEVLVAVTVMAIAGTVALFLYDASRKSFQKGENATEQQQAVRIAFYELSKDLRLAGFNYNPDGEDDDPDEPIEAAYDTAVVIRADFDAEDPTRSGTPEDTLAGGAHGAVSVGNDEIVAYVLANDSSRDTLRFEADVKDVPRDGIVETVEIPNVALVQSNPPYTLYRITLKEASDWGGASFVTRTPLVDDVYSMTFKYSGVEGSLGAVGGADTPAARSTRGEIRRIDVALKGLTHDPDLTWADPNDTNPATRSHRKFLLSGAVTPRNLGKKGMQDLGPGVGGGRTLGWDTTPPQKPGPPTLVVGHCDGLYITWPSNPPADRVAAYRVNYGTISGRPNAHRTLAATATYLSGLTNATNYYVTVQATDAAGNWSVPSDEQSAVTTNASTPKAPGGVVASLDRDDGVRLTWTAVTQNTTSDPTAAAY